MGQFLYNILLRLYAIAFRIAAVFNYKAKLGVLGRKGIFTTISRNQLDRNRQLIWMHCASLGEFEQGRPVLESLKKQYPGVSIVLTFFSASGYQAMKNYEGADHVYYLPFDSLSGAKKFVDALSPSLVLWVKYEFWYFYLHELKRRNIPVLLISGIFRSNHPFFKWYGTIWKKMLTCFTHFFVQNESSRSLLSTLDIYEQVTVTGDTRFDRVIEIANKFELIPYIKEFCGDHKIVVAGSTWEDDEAELIHYVKANPHIKFIIAPHETDAANLKDVKKEFTNAIFYSELVSNYQQQLTNTTVGTDLPGIEPVATHNVLIIDNVGMLSRLYHYADIAYVGGAFGADGVHNVLEAAVYGKPVIYGPEFEKFSEAIGLVESGGGITIQNALELESTLNELWNNAPLLAEKGAAAKAYVFAHAGASTRIIRFIQENRLLTN